MSACQWDTTSLPEWPMVYSVEQSQGNREAIDHGADIHCDVMKDHCSPAWTSHSDSQLLTIHHTIWRKHKLLYGEECTCHNHRCANRQHEPMKPARHKQDCNLQRMAHSVFESQNCIGVESSPGTTAIFRQIPRSQTLTACLRKQQRGDDSTVESNANYFHYLFRC